MIGLLTKNLSFVDLATSGDEAASGWIHKRDIGRAQNEAFLKQDIAENLQ